MHVKEPSYTYCKDKEFALVFLAVAAKCTAAPCKPSLDQSLLTVTPSKETITKDTSSEVDLKSKIVEDEGILAVTVSRDWSSDGKRLNA